ncbi:hypothetical protein CK203_039605 [Vitis vinifera]|uniref:Uncharacterized protein n=1 Tax=Vitis vinifera TaxID=29760 RepID=A0A438HFN3_VITVI|nr:hypothetical protein CK203_039605 [Vitis vinifera]
MYTALEMESPTDARREPFPDMDEAFMLVRGEESRSELMGKKDEDSSLATETSALKTNDTKRALVAGRPWSFKRNDQHDNSGVAFVRSRTILEKLAGSFMANLGMCQIKKHKREVLPVSLMLDQLNRKL